MQLYLPRIEKNRQSLEPHDRTRRSLQPYHTVPWWSARVRKQAGLIHMKANPYSPNVPIPITLPTSYPHASVLCIGLLLLGPALLVPHPDHARFVSIFILIQTLAWEFFHTWAVCGSVSVSTLPACAFGKNLIHLFWFNCQWKAKNTLWNWILADKLNLQSLNGQLVEQHHFQTEKYNLIHGIPLWFILKWFIQKVPWYYRTLCAT